MDKKSGHIFVPIDHSLSAPNVPANDANKIF